MLVAEVREIRLAEDKPRVKSQNLSYIGIASCFED